LIIFPNKTIIQSHEETLEFGWRCDSLHGAGRIKTHFECNLNHLTFLLLPFVPHLKIFVRIFSNYLILIVRMSPWQFHIFLISWSLSLKRSKSGLSLPVPDPALMVFHSWFIESSYFLMFSLTLLLLPSFFLPPLSLFFRFYLPLLIYALYAELTDFLKESWKPSPFLKMLFTHMNTNTPASTLTKLLRICLDLLD